MAWLGAAPPGEFADGAVTVLPVEALVAAGIDPVTSAPVSDRGCCAAATPAVTWRAISSGTLAMEAGLDAPVLPAAALSAEEIRGSG